MQSLEEEFQVTEYGVWGRDTKNWLSWTSASWLQYIIHCSPKVYILCHGNIRLGVHLAVEKFTHRVLALSTLLAHR